MSFNTIFFRLKSYCLYYWRARNNHYLHSPFVFEWYKLIRSYIQVDIKINEFRSNLKENTKGFNFTNNENEIVKTIVSKRYSSTSIDHKYGQILLNTSRYIGANHFIELGTSLGVSAAYMALSRCEIKGQSIDFNPNSIQIANELFQEYNIQNVQFHCGKFEDVLPQLLVEKNIDLVYIDGDHSYEATIHNLNLIRPFLNDKSVVILDDIRWSEDMFSAWEEIIQYSEFNYTIDFGRIGLIFKTQNQSPKQHFYLK